MRYIIVGCGRVGAELAQNLSQRGHVIVIVDQDPTSFERLGSTFKGQTILGVGFDRDVLIQAGIERADGVATVTASDEANIVAARVAKQTFHVPKVVARVYDPQKAEIYRRLGLQTISPVALGVHRLAELLTFSQLDSVVSLGSGEVEIVHAEIPALLAGRTVNELTVAGEINVIAITRDDKAFVPMLGTVLQKGDQVHIAVLDDAADRLKALLGM